LGQANTKDNKKSVPVCRVVVFNVALFPSPVSEGTSEQAQQPQNAQDFPKAIKPDWAWHIHPAKHTPERVKLNPKKILDI
jgi:hypothetical protein